MEGNNWRPAASQGEPAVDSASEDWRSQLHPDARERVVNKIMETLKKHLPIPVPGPEAISELKKIAVRFEETIYTAAMNQSDYLRRISVKMLSMEPKTQGTTATNSSPSNLGVGNPNPADSAMAQPPNTSSATLPLQDVHLPVLDKNANITHRVNWALTLADAFQYAFQTAGEELAAKDAAHQAELQKLANDKEAEKEAALKEAAEEVANLKKERDEFKEQLNASQRALQNEMTLFQNYRVRTINHNREMGTDAENTNKAIAALKKKVEILKAEKARGWAPAPQAAQAAPSNPAATVEVRVPESNLP